MPGSETHQSFLRRLWRYACNGKGVILFLMWAAAEGVYYDKDYPHYCDPHPTVLTPVQNGAARGRYDP